MNCSQRAFHPSNDIQIRPGLAQLAWNSAVDAEYTSCRYQIPDISNKYYYKQSFSAAKSVQIQELPQTVNGSSKGKSVEEIINCLPNSISIVFSKHSEALVQEASFLIVFNVSVNFASLVIAPQQPPFTRTQDLCRHHVGYHGDGIEASIHEISEEKEIASSQLGPRGPQRLAEELQIKQISVQISQNIDGRGYLQISWFFSCDPASGF